MLQVNGIDKSNYCFRTCRTQSLPSHNTHLHVSTAISIFSKYVRYFPVHQIVRISFCPLPTFFAHFTGMLGHPVVLKFSKTLLSTLVSSSRSTFPVWHNRVHLCLCLTCLTFIINTTVGSIMVYIYLSWGLFCK